MFAVTVAIAGEIRHPDVLYLDEAGIRPLALRTRRPVSLTFSRDQSTILAALRPGQPLWLAGYADRRYFVEARMVTGLMRGWVDADALEPLSLEQRAELDQRREQMRTNRAAIARHEVLMGMTPAEVTAAWGQPTEKSRTTTAESEEEIWRFISYRSEPYTQTSFVNGYYVTETLYRKVPTGARQVVFRNGQVVAIREGETVQPQPQTQTVIPVFAPRSPHPPHPPHRPKPGEPPVIPPQ